MVLNRHIMIVIVLCIVVSSIMSCVIGILGLVGTIDCNVFWLVALNCIGGVSVVIVMIVRTEMTRIFSKLFLAKECFKWSSKLKIITTLPSVPVNNQIITIY